jgi:ParB family chromosome partitioning protein
VFVSLAHDGRLRIDRGYVRPEDEPVAEGPMRPSVDGEAAGGTASSPSDQRWRAGPGGAPGGQDDEDDAIRPLPDRLVSELTAVRTVALRNALAQDSQAAFIAMLHALTLSVFRPHGTHGCVQIGVTQAWLGNVAPDLRETPWSLAIQERHEQWAARLPDEPGALWDAS